MHKHHDKKFFGVGTVGEKGQIVIPSDAREAMKIKTGDKFVFFGVGSMLHMIEADKLNSFLDRMTSFTAKVDEFKRSVQEKINKED